MCKCIWSGRGTGKGGRGMEKGGREDGVSFSLWLHTPNGERRESKDRCLNQLT